jgi:hypothetical protein
MLTRDKDRGCSPVRGLMRCASICRARRWRRSLSSANSSGDGSGVARRRRQNGRTKPLEERSANLTRASAAFTWSEMGASPLSSPRAKQSQKTSMISTEGFGGSQGRSGGQGYFAAERGRSGKTAERSWGEKPNRFNVTAPAASPPPKWQKDLTGITAAISTRLMMARHRAHAPGAVNTEASSRPLHVRCSSTWQSKPCSPHMARSIPNDRRSHCSRLFCIVIPPVTHCFARVAFFLVIAMRSIVFRPVFAL